MAILYDVEHITTYKYANPVTFGEHRAMFLPRAGHTGRILKHSETTNLPSTFRWLSDVLMNNVTIITFTDEPSTELTVNLQFRMIHFGVKSVEEFPLEARAEHIPVQYTPDEWTDLAPALRPHTEDPEGLLAAWAKSFMTGSQDQTTDVLKRMLNTIRDTLTYQPRETEGTQSPLETLRTQAGTCRDYAWLMIEALRRLGFACRFVSGYIYDATLDGGEVGMIGSGSTHAWVQIYLPGAGWLHYDPTNRITSGYDLIPVAVARHPGMAIPLIGSWFGKSQDYEGMSVTVAIRKIGEFLDQFGV